MAAVDPSTEIRILTPNMIDANSTITLSHGGTALYLYDRDRSNKYVTVGAKRDNIEMSVVIVFKIGTVETPFTLNSFLMMDHNLKSWDLSWWNSTTSTWIPFLGNDNETADPVCFTFGAILTSRIRLKALKTMLPNKEKSIGEIIIARQRFVIGTNPSVYNFNFRQKKRQLEMGNGDLHIAYTQLSKNRITRYGATVGWKFLSPELYYCLMDLKNEGSTFLWYPESVYRPSEIWLVHIISAWVAKYSSEYKGAGYDVTLELQEV